jgi:hypothetical protein
MELAPKDGVLLVLNESDNLSAVVEHRSCDNVDIVHEQLVVLEYALGDSEVVIEVHQWVVQ